jgi:PAS domain S-box-containing protein
VIPAQETSPFFGHWNALLGELTQERPLTEILAAVAKSLNEMLGGDHATVTLLDDRRQFFRIACEYPNSHPSLVGQKIIVKDMPAQTTLLSNHQPVVIPNVLDHPIFLESKSLQVMAERIGVQSMIIVPLMFNQSAEGTISLDFIREPHEFTATEVAACQTLAHLAALAVTRHRLLDEQERFRRQVGAGLLLARVQKVSGEKLEQLRTMIEFHKASLQLVMAGERTLAAAIGFDKETADPYLLRPVDQDPLISQLVRQQRLIVVPDTAADQVWALRPGTSDVNSWLGIPLIFRGRTIGLITLDHATPGYYGTVGPIVMGQIEEFCGQIAADIHNAYDLDSAQRQFHQVIGQVGEKIAATLKLQDLLPQLTTAIANGLNCSRAAIYLIGRQGDRRCLELKSASPALENYRTIDMEVCAFPNRPSPIQRAFEKDETILIEDVHHDATYGFTDPLFADAGSVLVAPLQIAGEAIGVVVATHQKPKWFGPADALLLETVAHHSGIAIQRGEGLDLVHSVGADTLSSTSLREVLQRFVSAAITLTRTDSGVIYLLNDAQNDIEAEFKMEGDIHPKPRLNNPSGITSTVIREARLVEISDIDKDPRVNPALLGEYRSMFAVPLALKGKVVGVLYLNGRSPKVLTETEKSLLYTLGDQAANFVLRMRLDERLSESEKMYHSLLDNIPQCIFRKDLNSRFVSANDAFCRSLGRPIEEVLGRDDYTFYERELALAYIQDDKQVMRTGEPLERDERHKLNESSKERWVHVVKTPVFDSAGNITGVQASFWDVTAQIETDKRRRQAEQRWKSLVEQSPDSIVVHLGGKITMANSAAVRLFGAKDTVEVLGYHMFDFVEPSYRETTALRLDQMICGERVEQGVPMKLLRKDGEVVDVEVYATAGPGTNEVQVVFHDLTGKQVLLREMHHRIRRSLNIIQGLLGFHQRLINDPRLTDAFNAIRQQIQAIALVHTILKDTARESDVQMRDYLVELVEAVASAFRSPVRNVEYTVGVDDNLTLDEKRATACGLIVNELVSNSLLYAFPARNGTISVALKHRAESYVLVVSDDGRGMSADASRVGDSMGLKLVSTLVTDDLKGTAEVRSAPNNGTRWQIIFPTAING